MEKKITLRCESSAMKKCSKFGLGVRPIVAAAAPAPPVPTPLGKPPFPLSSSSHDRRSSSWWFSNGNVHGRNTITTTTSSRATRRRWWSDYEGSQEDYGPTYIDYDYEDEAAFSGFGWAAELFDESWFSKVSKTHGVLLPVLLTSMFATTGLKAFLMAMAIPVSQSAVSFLRRRRIKGNRDDPWMIFFKKNAMWRRPLQEEEYPKDATDFATGGRGNGYSSSNYYEGRRRRRLNYLSWVPKDFTDTASTTSHGFLKSSGYGGGNKSSGASAYGGWDELLDKNTAVAQEAKKRSSKSYSQLATLVTARRRGLQRLGRKMQIIPTGGGVEQGVGTPPKRMRMRRRRMPRKMGLGSTGTRYKQAVPPLMRLLVAVFPCMGSWFRLL